MFVNKAYKVRIYPSNKQMIKINQNIGSARFIYNYYLNKKEKYYKENKTNLSLKEIKHDLVILKEEYPFLKECDSMALTNSLEDLDIACTNFFEKRSSYPKFKSKGVKDSYKTDCIRNSYKGNNYSNIVVDFENKTIKLPKLGMIKIRGYRNLKEFNHHIYNVTITKEANKYYASICVKEEIEEIEEIEDKEFKLKNALGIDLGVKTLVTTSDGIKYDKLDTKRIEKKIEDLQRRLSRCEKGSKNREKIKQKISRVYLKLRNKRKYYIHEITKELADNNDLIITENLKVKDMIMNKENHLSKHLSNASFNNLIKILTYKMAWRGKKLLQVNTYYPSSQKCCRCDYKNEKVKDLSVREFECDNCGYIADRDINASINILFKGIEIYYKELYRFN